jgi:hypothetical protein
MSNLESVRQIVLSLPDCQEVDQYGAISFRVRGKIFAQFSADQSQILVKLPASLQTALIAAEPGDFVSEPHWGGYGWTRIRLAALSVEQLRPLLVQSWRLLAPKALTRDNPSAETQIIAS